MVFAHLTRQRAKDGKYLPQQGSFMAMEKNRRLHKRLALNLNVTCQTVGLAAGRVYTGTTVDVSTGGALIEMNGKGLNDGQLVSVEMSVPPTEGLLDFGGRLSNYARIIRIDDEHRSPENTPSTITQMIALEFCESPKLHI